jgi:hypothetical protein
MSRLHRNLNNQQSLSVNIASPSQRSGRAQSLTRRRYAEWHPASEKQAGAAGDAEHSAFSPHEMGFNVQPGWS